MATIGKVTKVANPYRHRRRKARGLKRRTPPRNKSGRFTKRKRATGSTKRRNPRRKPATLRRRKATSTRRRRKTNPVLIELGAINPYYGTGKSKRRKTNVAKRRKRSNPRRTHRRHRRHVTAVAPVRRRRRRSRNPVAHTTRRRYHRRRRSHNPMMRRRNRRHSYRRNPGIFGQTGGKNLLMMVGGGLVGVAATKFLPTLLPATLTASLGGSPIIGVLLTGAGAFVASWLARKISPGFGDAVLFGGLMQAGSVALTAFAPAPLAQQLALSGLGDILPGNFVVPQNPIISRGPVAMISSGTGASKGVGAFGGAFGGRR